MNIEEERKAFNEQFGIDDANTFPAFGDGIDSSAVLKCNWLGWVRCAEQKQAEIKSLKSELAKAQVPEGFVLVLNSEIGFGDFCTIEQNRYGVPNEFYQYKIIGRKRSNSWTKTPVDPNNEKETLHDHLDDVVTVVCNNLDDRTVHQFRVSDLASVVKAQAVPEWISVDDRMPQYDMDVLVCFGDDNIPEIDSLIPGESLDYFSNSGCDVKYWMPLPQLPEQEQSND